jgi:CelD/BcsL family acetyltransferase involved in cellulose biosynthesis
MRLPACLKLPQGVPCMRITVVKTEELSEAELSRWREIQASDLDLASPYFCPEFIQAVSAVRSDVLVGVVEDESRIVGFFPFQRRRFGQAVPVGGMLSDFHGLICEPGYSWSITDLFKGCGINSYKYHYLLTKQTAFSTTEISHADSHYMDLSKGFKGYVDALEARGSKIIKDNAYKTRKLGRDFGPVRFVPNDPSPGILNTLFEWKSRQYVKGGLTDVFSFSWTRELLERICSIQSPGFSGMLSALYTGDKVISIHMGMRSSRSWNWWFPRHDTDFNLYSPGIMTRLFAAEHAAEIGLLRMDLGKGDADSYKPTLSTGAIPVSVGTADIPCLATTMRRCMEQMETKARKSPLVWLIRVPGHVIKRLQVKSRYH